MIEWNIHSLKQLCEKIGFSEIRITWIMRCITSVKYKVHMNSQSMKTIVPKKKSTSRRSFVSFIFILCTEAFISLLNHIENQGKIIRCPSASHFLFAGNSFFFCKTITGTKAESMSWMVVGSILSVEIKIGWKDGDGGRLAIPFCPN